MSALLIAKAAPYIAALVAMIAAILGLRSGIRKDAKREADLKSAERYAKQRKAIDDAESHASDDPAILRELLKHRDPGTR